MSHKIIKRKNYSQFEFYNFFFQNGFSNLFLVGELCFICRKIFVKMQYIIFIFDFNNIIFSDLNYEGMQSLFMFNNHIDISR